MYKVETTLSNDYEKAKAGLEQLGIQAKTYRNNNVKQLVKEENI